MVSDTLAGLRRLGVAIAVAIAVATPSHAQTRRSASLGRFSLFYNFDRRSDDSGSSTDFSLATAYIDFHSPVADGNGFQYAVDARITTYPSSERSSRANVYDAWVGGTVWDGRVGIRLGQMWLNELGALGSVGGVNVEWRRQLAAGTRFRAGLFGGLEPKTFETGYTAGIEKGGAYAVYEGRAARRHVLGFVAIRNQGAQERSVLTTTNFIPAGSKFFFYQIAEYDLHGPAGEGPGGLNYFFTTIRATPASFVELQLNYHHGRSIDARTITDDQLHGRPVDPRLLEGYLYESVGGRLTFNLSRTVRVYGSYAQERNNRDDRALPRVSGGVSLRNLFHTGLDVTTYASRFERSRGPYTSIYASIGRSLGTRWYVSVDYTSSLSVLRIASGDGLVVENRPHAQRLALSSQVNLGRRFSLFLNLERLEEDSGHEDRLATGLSIRF